MSIKEQNLNNTMSTHTYMSSKNISIKKEAYDYLKSIKAEDESFSDIILKLKKEKKNNGLTLIKIANKYREKQESKYWKEREENIESVRKTFSN